MNIVCYPCMFKCGSWWSAHTLLSGLLSLDDFKGLEEIVKREETGLRKLGVYTEATASLGL